jgi:hypothetical protein
MPTCWELGKSASASGSDSPAKALGKCWLVAEVVTLGASLDRHAALGSSSALPSKSEGLAMGSTFPTAAATRLVASDTLMPRFESLPVLEAELSRLCNARGLLAPLIRATRM